MRKLKVLRDQLICREGLPEIMAKRIRDELERLFERREPIIGRNGWYYDRQEKVTWYEAFGFSWWKKTQKDRDRDVKQFKYTMDLLSYEERPLTREQRRGLGALAMRKGPFRQPARYLLYMAQCSDMGRSSHREAVKSRRRLMGR